MDTIAGDYYVIDDKLLNSSEINFQFNNSEYLFYEVMRTTRGIVLFLEEHLERLFNSIRNFDLERNTNTISIQNSLQLLIDRSAELEGNIKLLCKPLISGISFAAYFIPYFYPDENMYKQGIKLTTYAVERNEPQIKQIKTNEEIKREINHELQNSGAFEVLLVNRAGYITEGSKSNFFLIRGNSLYSAPEEIILKGITRNYVLNIANSLGIRNIPTLIKTEELADYEAAFICGTSPKVMPVKTINKMEFDVKHNAIQDIRREYDRIIENYLREKMTRS
jgi:branched-chain amino acid aminotransferase